ncbi:hypothetical protein CPHO_03860 [Corynebacterium phocae]|uniref:Uncharacterized protein n=1 Tax=Corynebacterium phocae TaxID=161895 RepID=A0A1L7D265_9CORY|nr:hypothetical protein [Corynebacterium phocae]APT92163.1 hypothetical protein CPHO_03860 [Corynebacterium phocae]KAA8725949.1 hypothetical protein F4V58_03405 [Corynebacterium phocae]
MEPKAIAGWVVGALALAFLLSAGYFLMNRGPEIENPVTVAQAVAARTGGTPGEQGSSSRPGDQTVMEELLSTIGLPDEAVKNYDLSGVHFDEAKRAALIGTLERSIDEGMMSVSEARAVLKAFDLGIVDTEVRNLVFEDSSRKRP